MGKLTSLITGKLVAFDTAPLIYYIEEYPDYLPLADELFDAFDKGNARGMTSALTLHEVLVKPLRDGRQDLADKYHRDQRRALGTAHRNRSRGTARHGLVTCKVEK